MSFEDLVVFFVFFEFCVERPKVILGAFYVVAEPLFRTQEEGSVAKVILEVLLSDGGGAQNCTTGGRTTQQKKKLYDSTLGYPGEDGATRPHQRRIRHHNEGPSL